MRGLALPLVLAALAGPAGAALTLPAACTFSVECFEAEACDETALRLALTRNGTPDTVRIGSVAEHFTAQRSVTERGATVLQALGPTSAQILSVGPDGTARYSLHLTDGPAALTYLGTCEASK